MKSCGENKPEKQQTNKKIKKNTKHCLKDSVFFSSE